MRELQRLLGVSFSSTRYNVEKLSKYGKVLSKRDRGHLRLFPPGTTELDIMVYSQLRNESSKSILVALSDSKEPLSNKDICVITSLAKSTVSENLQRLVGLGLVNLVISDKLKNAYALNSTLDITKMISDSKSLPYSATDRFIDLWDF